MDDILILIAQKREQDENGVWRMSRTTRQVFCKVHSIRQSEFFAGGRNGLNPEFQFTVFGEDYEGESLCEYSGESYAIYRTFKAPGNDYIELYVERKGGTNGKEDPD